VALGAFTWTRDRRRTLDLQDSEQARRVGAILEWVHDPAGNRQLRATVMNASDLPIRDIGLTSAPPRPSTPGTTSKRLVQRQRARAPRGDPECTSALTFTGDAGSTRPDDDHQTRSAGAAGRQGGGPTDPGLGSQRSADDVLEATGRRFAPTANPGSSRRS